MEKKNFSIIRHRGQQNKAQLEDGTWVERQEFVLVPEYGGFVRCADYLEHFIYENPNTKQKGSAYLCTCGSMAVLTGPGGYVLDASPQGKMMVCYVHATTGLHTTGGTKWI